MAADRKTKIQFCPRAVLRLRGLDTMLLQLRFSGDDTGTQLEVQVVPAVQSGCRTTFVPEEDGQRRIYDFLESISVNVEISDQGIVTETG